MTNELKNSIPPFCLGAALATAMLFLRKPKEKSMKTLDDYSYRDLFHFFINPEFHTDKFHLAKEFSERMHREAAEYMLNDHVDNPDFPDHFTYFPYDKEKIHQRLDYIFARLFKEKYLDWCDAGQLITDDSRYWWAKTKVHLTTYLIQRQPFHLTDGAWLRGVLQGPMSSIQAKLFSIYIDELGNGDPNQNHCNVYLDVLESLGLKVPPVTSRDFVDQQSILEIAFKKPLLTLTTSLFPKTFEPEILGYTLWLETTSAAEHAGLRKILDRYDLNPKFSLLHTAIDNNLNGHGRYARDAVDEYLAQIEQNEGPEALESYWKRIWTGYVAYGTTGNFDEELRKLFDEQRELTAREEFLALIRKKAPLAQHMHGSRRVGPKENLLNEMFASEDVETLCDELANSDMIVKGDPNKSKFLNHAVAFHGPMYQIFDADELAIVTRWILSLAPSTLNDMLALIIQRRKFGRNIAAEIKLKLPDGTEQILRDLFDGKPADLLAAFRASLWTIPADGSKLTEENVETTKLMISLGRGQIFENVFNRDGSDKKLIRKWLIEGAPIPGETLENDDDDDGERVKIVSHETFKFEF